MAVVIGTDVNQAIADIDTYWSVRGNTSWASQGSSAKEAVTRKAADWLERNFTARGQRATADQRLSWPRLDAYDNDSYQIGATEAPLVWREAEAIIADLYRDGTFDLEGIIQGGDAAITKEKVDVIEVEYSATERVKGADVVSHVYIMLRAVTIDDSLLRT